MNQRRCAPPCLTAEVETPAWKLIDPLCLAGRINCGNCGDPTSGQVVCLVDVVVAPTAPEGPSDA